MPVLDHVKPVGRVQLLRPLPDAQVGESYLGARLGARGFRKPVVVRCVSPPAVEPIIEEAARAASLCHAGIAHVIDAGVAGGMCFVVAEHLPGTRLDVLLGRQKLTWRSLARILCDAAGALVYAHGKRRPDGRFLRLVHGRIAPSRITVADSGRAHITGFGASWAWPNPGRWGSPEERRGEPIDGRADVYALGRIIESWFQDRDGPRALLDVGLHATRSLPEHRCTPLEMRRALQALLRG